jgi:hypothetical protein
MINGAFAQEEFNRITHVTWGVTRRGRIEEERDMIKVGTCGVSFISPTLVRRSNFDLREGFLNK